MRKILTSISLCLAAGFSFAQVGATAPNFTVTDINGASHTLYSYLNAGKVVLLDVSATWCGPCWNFHNAHYLEDLYAEYGPNGSDEVVVLFYEGDASTNADDLNGVQGSGSQGDWVTGTPYPIINETPLQLDLNIFAPLGFPTINVICPSDKKIKWDLWDSQTSTTAQSLQNMKNKVDEVIGDCALSAGINELSILEATLAPNPTKGNVNISFTSSAAERVTIELYSISGARLSSTDIDAVNGTNTEVLDLSSLQSGTYFVKVSSASLSGKMIPVVKN